ncbi:hypothetical protein [Amycolatopsis palatopharyngis]|uniref:hypothetical protein n=1 Tax=Amycolatopsis palatopharyngis TaxID=187982 RepID=UPI000E25F137|nr:hypothetical protein [Amycolatopsis palatopharyngis]
MPDGPFYMLLCRTCAAADSAAATAVALPFTDEPARRGWAAAHTAATGHNSWVVRTDDSIREPGSGRRGLERALSGQLPDPMPPVNVLRLLYGLSLVLHGDTDPPTAWQLDELVEELHDAGLRELDCRIDATLALADQLAGAMQSAVHRHLVTAFAGMAEHLQGTGLLTTGPAPSSAKARALHFRQTRNTGPRPQPRTPRRIDGRGTRR